MREMQEHQQFWDPPRQTHKIQFEFVERRLSVIGEQERQQIGLSGTEIRSFAGQAQPSKKFSHPPTLFCFVSWRLRSNLVRAYLILFTAILRPEPQGSRRGAKPESFVARAEGQALSGTRERKFRCQTWFHVGMEPRYHITEILGRGRIGAAKDY